MSTIDHSYTEEIVCPYCGYEFSDSFEQGESGEMDCYECNRRFYMESQTEVTYSTHKLDDEPSSQAGGSE